MVNCSLAPNRNKEGDDFLFTLFMNISKKLRGKEISKSYPMRIDGWFCTLFINVITAGLVDNRYIYGVFVVWLRGSLYTLHVVFCLSPEWDAHASLSACSSVLSFRFWINWLRLFIFFTTLRVLLQPLMN